MATNFEKAAELLKDQDFFVKVSECGDKDAAIALFAEKGVTVTADDLADLGALLQAFRDNDGEIPDEVAEQVAGGAFDVTKIGDLLGAFGTFLTSLQKPLNSLIKIFAGDDSSSGGSSGSDTQPASN